MGTAHVQPSHSYLALSSDHLNFVKFDQNTLDKCSETHDTYICSATEPILLTSGENDCEINMLLRPSTAYLKQCEVMFKSFRTTQWTYLETVSAWLFSTTTEERIRIRCGNAPIRNVNLQGAGLLRIASGCQGMAKEAVLVSQDWKETEFQYTYKPEVTLDVVGLYPILADKSEDLLPAPMDSKVTPENHQKESLRLIIRDMDQISSHKRSLSQTNYTMYGGFAVQLLIIAIVTVTMRRLQCLPRHRPYAVEPQLYSQISKPRNPGANPSTDPKLSTTSHATPGRSDEPTDHRPKLPGQEAEIV